MSKLEKLIRKILDGRTVSYKEAEALPKCGRKAPGFIHGEYVNNEAWF